MKLNVIAVRDIKANVYSQPQFVGSIGHAVRSFGDQCRNKENGNIMGQHPEDFELYLLGEFDDEHATWTMLEKPKQIALGQDYAK